MVWCWHSHDVIVRYPEREYVPMPVIPHNQSPGKLLVVSVQGGCIKSDCGRVRPVKAEDWVWVNSTVPDQLRAFVDIGYTVVLVDIIPEGSDMGIIVARMNRVVEKLAFDPFIVLGRMAGPWMWQNVVRANSGRVGPDSMFCGPAGELAVMSCLGQNSVPIVSPEQIYLSVGVNMVMYSSEVLIMVGPPKSGKTKFVETVLKPKGYLVADMAVQGETIRDLLELGFSVVVDGCHPTRQERARILAAAGDFPCRIVWLVGKSGEEDIARRTYAVRFERPTEVEVIQVD